MQGDCCCGSCTPRNFHTREEKMEMLKEYQDGLEKEIQAVKERIADLKKG